MALEYVKSQKGKDQLKDNDFLFHHEKTTTSKTIWRCIEYKSGKCQARIHTTDGPDAQIIARIQEHNHLGRGELVGAKKFLSEVKRKAREGTDTPHQIIASCSERLPESVAGALSKIDVIKRTVRRARQTAPAPIPTPRNLLELEIPKEYKITGNGALFLQHDTGPGDDRILIFSTNENLEFLDGCENWYADGTFKTAPTPFEQVYTIHGLCDGNVLPAVFALLPNKSKQTYTRLFTLLNILKPGLSPISIMTDFETSQIAAFKDCFPTVETRGSFFHFCQSIWRNIQSNADLCFNYTDAENPDFALHVRQLPALAFVPEENVVAAFETLLQTEFFQANETLLLPLVNYFEDTWIGRLTVAGTRRAPVFIPRFWNCYSAAVQGMPRTHNSIEAWHRGFVSLLGMTHPSIWKFIARIKQEQSGNEVKMAQVVACHHTIPNKRAYRNSAKNMENIVKEYNTANLGDYLRGLAHNFALPV